MNHTTTGARNTRRWPVLVPAVILIGVGLLAVMSYFGSSDSSANSLLLGLTLVAMGGVLGAPLLLPDVNPVNFMMTGYGIIMVLGGIAAFFAQRADDADTATAVVTSSSLVIIGALLIYFGRFGGTSGDAKLLRDGVAGRARVLDVDETNIVVNNRSVILRVRLLVQVPGRAEYEANARVTASFLQGTSLHQGQDVAVRVDPQRSGRVMIDWARTEP